MTDRRVNNVAPATMSIGVEHSVDHLDLLTRSMAYAEVRKASGSMQGLQLNVADVQNAISEQLKLVLELASLGAPYNAELRSLFAVSWPLIRDVFPCEQSGSGLTTKLYLKASQSAGTGTKVEEAGIQPVDLLRSVDLINQIESVGVSGGITQINTGVDAGGNFGVMSATAEWLDGTCFVYHSAQLSNDQLRLVAALNLQGGDVRSYGVNPSVAKTMVVANGISLIG